MTRARQSKALITRRLHRDIPVLAFLAIAVANAAVASASGPWLTGADFRKQMDRPIGLTWSANPLRDALNRLARDRQVAIFLDRRVDPGRKIDFAVTDTPLDEALALLAGQQRLGVGLVGPVVYIGPPETAGKLATLTALKREAIRRLPKAAQKKFFQSRPWRWDDLATPRELLDQLADESGIRMMGADTIPHDLWPRYDLPPLGLVERLTLVLAGFDRTFEFSADGRAIRLIPMPKRVALERTYPIGPKAEAWAAKLAERFPELQIRHAGNRLVVVGRLEDHERIAALLRGEPVRRATVGRQEKVVHSLTIENQRIGPLMKALAAQLGMKIKFDPRVAGKLDRTVSFSVKEAPLEQLLKAALEPAGLAYRLEEGTIEVVPRP